MSSKVFVRELHNTVKRTNSQQLKPGLRFRDFISQLQKDGDLIEINKEVDPHLEIGAITRKVYEERLPAPLFNNVKGQQKNLFRILGAPGGLRQNKATDHARIAHHLNLPSNTHVKDIINFLLDAKNKTPIPPHQVTKDQAPIKENLIQGDEIDLTKIPVPFLHHGDGGKYIQTYGMFILETPDKSWTNWSIARGMVKSKNEISGLVINPQHIRVVAEEWAKIGKGDQIPFTLCFGVPPAAILVSSMPIPEGISEQDYIGAILGESLPVIKAETNDILVPATSEIVLEGTLNLNDLSPEGPFGEMHGYVFKGHSHPGPTYKINSISYRNNSIMPISNPGLATDETHTLIGTLVAAEAKQIAIENDLPIIDVFSPYESQALWLVMKIDLKKLQSLNTTPEEFSNKIGEIFFNTKVAFIMHEIILVGDDIDIFDFKQVIWAYTTRHTPGDDQYYFPNVKSFALAPFVSQSERIKTLKGGKFVTNCIFPKQYKQDIDFTTCNFDGYDEEIKNKVLTNWESYGYEKLE
ncbi:green fluorescent protein (GFP)-fusion protein localizes to the cytoplasm [Wickerhamomyces ciferrii]|uniref:Ferulic acid decarboxylase 1 n=1 Tax=Wickerhamomyces ciferrii (strain ATCC 14091 / BCRC 22168 / CBS 111 / JCM 3599 / NBRC 0793 / NRRL Y-1031 F-60-10) TaxID=1206466 RepID=K0KNG7_WICCF|nr:green fluorescent protein (GFP)-fusion protein localizes to the cytoplasm [Wickerhamomyces ciferrii]CCH46770.1 green fluorescent protein (GFP)-fusion protein localizes to the cytoplasm [Wickerhamomyces ciferrii]